MQKPKYKTVLVEKLIPYARNSRTQVILQKIEKARARGFNAVADFEIPQIEACLARAMKAA